jgi:hypothetical protein
MGEHMCMSLLFRYQEPRLETEDLFARTNALFLNFSHRLCQESEQCIEQELQIIRDILGQPSIKSGRHADNMAF